MHVDRLLGELLPQAIAPLVFDPAELGEDTLTATGARHHGEYTHGEPLQVRHAAPILLPPLVRWHCANHIDGGLMGEHTDLSSELVELVDGVLGGHSALGVRSRRRGNGPAGWQGSR